MGLFDRLKRNKDEEVDDEQYDEVENDSEFGDQEEQEYQDPDEEYYKNQRSPSTSIGQPSIVNIIANSYWSTDDVMQEYFIMRETMKHRTYGIVAYAPPSGFGRAIDTSVFEELLSEGNIDLTEDIVPHPNQQVMRSLSNISNVILSNTDYQQQKGQTFQLHDNITKYNDIQNFLDELQFDENRMYDLNLSLIVYGSSEREMNRNFSVAQNALAKKGISITPYVKRVKSGYLQTIPIGARMYNIEDTYRNFDRKALSVMDMARNASGRFNGGIPFGVNQVTPSHNVEFLNVFGTKTHRPINYNMGIIAESGAGKSTSNKIKMAREMSILGIEHRCIDPDGEYVMLAKKLGGLNLNITQDAEFRINPCALATTETALDEEIRYDATGRQLTDEEIEDQIRLGNDNRTVVTHADGQKFIQKVNIAQMYDNVKGFINEIIISNKGERPMTVSEIARLNDALQAIIKRLGITTDPNSLYTDESGTRNNKFYERLPKLEPTLTDIYNELIRQNTDKDGNEDPKIERLLDAIKPYLRTGNQPIFDGQTYFGPGRAADLNDYLFVNFNIAELQGDFKRVAYYVITQYLWERWMKNPIKATTKKVLDADEILQFIDDDEMFKFFDTIVRRCRKRNGSLCWITQDIAKFKDNTNAGSLVTNSEFEFVLQTKPEHRDLLKNALDLTEGALDRLTSNPAPGEGILRAEGESIWIRTNPSAKEMEFAESNRAVQLARENKNVVDQINERLKS